MAAIIQADFTDHSQAVEPDARFKTWDYQAFRNRFARALHAEIADDLNMSRPTDAAALERIDKFKALTWRAKHWQGVKLSWREREAVVREREVIAAFDLQYRDLEIDVKANHQERMKSDLTIYNMTPSALRLRQPYYERMMAEDLEAGRRKIGRGIQNAIARDMGITQVRVSQLLKSAALVMEYLIAQQDGLGETYIGWVDENAGKRNRQGKPLPPCWMLHAPYHFGEERVTRKVEIFAFPEIGQKQAAA